MKKLFLTILACGIFVTPAYANSRISNNKKDGILRFKSIYSVRETAQRFEYFAKEQGLKIVAKVDHQAGAESVKQKLRPTRLIIFGNPKAGTPLMQCNQIAAIDLPQKALIWEDKKGKVWLGYNSPKYLFFRHRLKGCGEEAIQKIENALNTLAQKVTQ
ncbi:MAG: DUF302 domain-containing protein [Mastigocoleus sp. MO_167.B18]|nr:DUF302 domain-containing protein [Mastigocoleus sp. MO_167.B18]